MDLAEFNFDFRSEFEVVAVPCATIGTSCVGDALWIVCVGARSGDSESSRDAIDDASDRLVDESRDVKLDSAMDIWRFEFSADTGYGYLLVIMKMRRLKI